MFKRNSVPQRQPFSISREQLIEDIRALSQCEEQRNKLFWCLDEKPPQDNKLSRLEEFLKGTNNLEDISKTLANSLQEVRQLKDEISQNIENVKERARSIYLISEDR